MPIDEVGEAFVLQIAPIMIEQCGVWGLKFPSIGIAQALMESTKGTSELAVNAFNIFGKKWNKDRFPAYYKLTNEYLKLTVEEAVADGWGIVNAEKGLYNKYLPFNHYPSWNESVSHYCENLMTAKWYAVPRLYLWDFTRFLVELAPVYAPNHPTYVDDVMARIDKYDLRKYDPGLQ